MLPDQVDGLIRAGCDCRLFQDRVRRREPRIQQLVSAKSAEQAFEIQSQYAKKAYDAYVAQASKLGEMWVDLARATYKPVTRAVAKKAA